MSTTIAFYTPYLEGTFFRQVRAGVYDITRQNGVRLVIIQAPLADILAQRVAWQHIDGWVTVVGTQGADAIIAMGKPLVTISYPVPGASMVQPDNIGGTRALVSHLIGLGHRRIGFIGQLNDSDMSERYISYSETLAQAGIAVDQRLVINTTDKMPPDGAQAGREFLAKQIDADAFVAGNDNLAYGLMSALRDHGLRIPEDIAVVGFDDDAKAQVASPPLTTVRQSYPELGRAAVQQLLRQIADPTLPATKVIAATQLIVRESCGIRQANNNTTSPISAQPIVAGLVPGSEKWKEVSARQLTNVLLYPSTLQPTTAADSIWPGVTAIIAMITASLFGGQVPQDSALQQAWIEANEIAAYPNLLGSLLDSITTIVDTALQTPGANIPTHVQTQAVLARVRDPLLSISLGASARQLPAFEERIHDSNLLNSQLVSALDSQIETLTWMRDAGFAWACMGLWHTTPGGDLRVTGAIPELPKAQRIACAAFPLLPQDLPATHVINIATIRTAQRDWGLIAFSSTYSDMLSYIEMSSRWIELLGTRLDNKALFEQLASERSELQTSYERERALADTVRDLGCPIIPLTNGILLIPLIGLIDSARAQLIIDSSLTAVSLQRASSVLIDVSGVPLIDTHVAGVLIQLARMVQLLGAKTGIVGIRPEIAQSIVSLGVDLRQIQTYASLAAALLH